MAYLEMFPEEYIELRQELSHVAHADVRMKFYEENTHTDMPSQLGVLAGILGLAVQGMFGPEDIKNLAIQVRKKLEEKRKTALWTVGESKIIVPNDGGMLS